MGVVYGIVYKQVGIVFLSIWLSKLERVIIFFFGMINGLGTLLLRPFT